MQLNTIYRSIYKPIFLSMGLLCLGCVLSDCSFAPPRYVIELDRLTGTAPATSDNRLKEMVSVRLLVDHRWQAGDTDIDGTVGTVAFRVYELMDDVVDDYERRTTIQIDFYQSELAGGFRVMFAESVDPKEAMRRLGFDREGLFKHPFVSDTWIACVGERIYRVEWKSVSAGRHTVVTVRYLE